MLHKRLGFTCSNKQSEYKLKEKTCKANDGGNPKGATGKVAWRPLLSSESLACELVGLSKPKATVAQRATGNRYPIKGKSLVFFCFFFTKAKMLKLKMQK
jgi:hypothetical protein